MKLGARRPAPGGVRAGLQPAAHRGAGAGGAAPHAGGCRLSAAVGAGPAVPIPIFMAEEDRCRVQDATGRRPLSRRAGGPAAAGRRHGGGIPGPRPGGPVRPGVRPDGRVAAAAAVPAGDPRGRSVRRHESAVPRPGGTGGLNQKKRVRF